MVALNFPSDTSQSPYTENGITYEWDGKAWNKVSGGVGDGANVHIGDSPPANPEEGDLWWDSSDDSGRLYVWYEDANTNQWVEASPAGGDSAWERVGTTIQPKVATDNVEIGGGDIELNADGSATIAGPLEISTTNIATTDVAFSINNDSARIDANGSVFFSNNCSIKANTDEGLNRSHYWMVDSANNTSFVNYTDFGSQQGVLFSPQGGATDLVQIKAFTDKFFTNLGRTIVSPDSGEGINTLKNNQDSNYMEVLTTLYGAKGINYTINSDIRLKTNIEPSTVDVTNIINNLDFISFNWKDAETRGADKVKLGVSAQQLQSLDPELVAEFSDGYLFLKSNEMALYALKGLQEALARIDALEAEVASLKGGNN